MSQPESILIAPLPKPVVRIGTPIAAVLLTSFFILWGFPYHHLTHRITAMAGESLGVELEAADSGLTLGLDGPGFRFQEVRVETRTGEVYRLESVRLGPAWSLSWLTATPSLFFDLESEIGSSRGTVRTGDAPGLSGSIEDLALAELTFLEEILPISLSGTLDAEGDIQTSDGDPTGPVTFDLRDGLIGHPILPLDIPYKTIHGALTLGGEQRLRVDAFELTGPLLSFDVSGSVGRADTIASSPLDLEIDFKNVPPQMRSIIQSIGGRVGSDGSSKLHIGGSVSDPIIN